MEYHERKLGLELFFENGISADEGGVIKGNI